MADQENHRKIPTTRSTKKHDHCDTTRKGARCSKLLEKQRKEAPKVKQQDEAPRKNDPGSGHTPPEDDPENDVRENRLCACTDYYFMTGRNCLRSAEEGSIFCSDCTEYKCDCKCPNCRTVGCTKRDYLPGEAKKERCRCTCCESDLAILRKDHDTADHVLNHESVQSKASRAARFTMRKAALIIADISPSFLRPAKQVTKRKIPRSH